MTETLNIRASDRLTTGLVIAGASALMLATMGRAVVLLVIALLLSYALWLARSTWPSPSQVMPAFWFAAAIQSVHLIEEYRTGFYRLFPSVMGVDAWPAHQFLAFNFIWLALFLLAGIGVGRAWRPAYVVAVFLAIGGGIGNGLGHIALAIHAGGYFPGTFTAPLVFLAGAFLAIQLFRPAHATNT